ncbi:MAG: type II toxin-antitoxin system RelE/ParE family toxin [Gammaproteobacteria bacterium]|nr:type II toxin-antitoxin system RelE/ParE family toxin [Gammaproteobacteria bacterium]
MTTPYSIKIAPAARRQILTLANKQQKLIVKLLEALAINPRPPGAQKISGMTGLYSETVNHLRLIYKIEDQELLLLLVKSI